MLTLSLAVMVVNTSLRIPADFRHLFEHSRTVADYADLTPFVVVPANRDLPEPQTVKMRNVKEFDVESEPLDLHQIQQRPKLRHIECLETALSVPKRHSRESSYHQIENLPALFTPPRLVRADQT